MRYFILISGMILALASSASGEIYVVNPEGTGDFPTIQAAIDAVVDGDIIELTDGTFTGDGNRDIDYLGKAITVRSQSGDPETCVIDCEGSEAEPHRGFHFHTGEVSTSVLEGVTISGGYAPEDYPHNRGGGVYCESSSPTFTDCTFSGNWAYIGGGMLCFEGSSCTITSCTFSDNSAHGGGGMLCYISSPTVTSCTFSGNSADYDGGGVQCDDCHSTFTDCSFTNNWADEGGGMYTVWSDPTLADCTFRGNSAGMGGGINCYDSSPTLADCTFRGNWADEGGGMRCYDLYASTTLTGCTFTNNAAIEGGGITCYQSSLTLENTIIAFSTQGEAIYCEGETCNPTLTCCDIYGNEGGDWVDCIAPWAPPLNGNICEDPLFCDPENDDFHLHCTSPCAPFTPPNPECDLIGAWPVGCGGTPVTSTTWGGIKAIFRQ